MKTPVTKSMKSKFLKLALVALLLPASPTFAKTWLSASELARNPDGYAVDLGRNKTAYILKMEAPRGKKSECVAHLPSLKKEILKLGDIDEGTKAIVTLRWRPGAAEGDLDSPLLNGRCFGAGAGCTFVFTMGSQ